MDPFLGEIRIFAGNFAPKDWAYCNGQLLPIAQYSALFSLLGNYYGGNGTTNFALPNLQGTAPMCWGSGAGLSPYNIGQTGGVPTVSLTTSQGADHPHTMQCSESTATANAPTGNLLASTFTSLLSFLSPADSSLVPLSPQSIVPAGSGAAHNNMQPFLAMSYIIALQGIFPTRPS